ncbi:MAG: hypothetical protein ACYS8W_10270 [Planctomycetota bacterium]|jgi:hypothetical protein
MKYYKWLAIPVCIVVIAALCVDCSSGSSKKRYNVMPPEGVTDIGDITDIGGEGSGIITVAKPIDTYYFTLAEQRNVVIYVWPTGSSTLDSMINLYDENDTKIQYTNDNADGPNPYLTRNLTPALYKFEVFPENGTVGDYSFRIVVLPGSTISGTTVTGDFRLDLGEFTGAANASDTADTSACTTSDQIYFYTVALDVPLSLSLDVTQVNIDGMVGVLDVKTLSIINEARQTLALTSQAAGLYLISVRDETNAKAGSYDLNVTITP